MVICLNEFLDEFYTDVPARQTMIDAAPSLVDPTSDTYLGAVGEHLARRWDLVIPPWTELPPRFALRTPLFPEHSELMKAIYLRDSPYAFRRRMIFTEWEPLRRARLPRDQILAHPSETP